MSAKYREKRVIIRSKVKNYRGQRQNLPSVLWVKGEKEKWVLEKIF